MGGRFVWGEQKRGRKWEGENAPLYFVWAKNMRGNHNENLEKANNTLKNEREILRCGPSHTLFCLAHTPRTILPVYIPAIETGCIYGKYHRRRTRSIYWLLYLCLLHSLRPLSYIYTSSSYQTDSPRVLVQYPLAGVGRYTVENANTKKNIYIIPGG